MLRQWNDRVLMKPPKRVLQARQACMAKAAGSSLCDKHPVSTLVEEAGFEQRVAVAASDRSSSMRPRAHFESHYEQVERQGAR
jgi:hypothetical protein